MKLRTVLLFAVMLVANACGPEESAAPDSITVFAAASLTEAFTQIATDFEDQHGTTVRLSFGPSDGLATQIQEGAPADVFASADYRRQMVAVFVRRALAEAYDRALART